MTNSCNFFKATQGTFTVAALVVGVLFPSRLLAQTPNAGARAESAVVSASPVVTAFDGAAGESDQMRASFGQIFIGAVVARAGEERVPTSDPEDGIQVTLFNVRIEKTLRGFAQGTVRVWFEGAEESVSPDGHSHTLEPGDRALFFAGFNPATGVYPVNAEVGIIRITGAPQAAQLVEHFVPIIEKSDRDASRKPQPVACENPGVTPHVSLSQTRASEGDQLALSGGPFPRMEAAVWLDDRNTLLGAVPIGPDCQIEAGAVVQVPALPVGDHTIIVTGSMGRPAEVPLQILESR